jgi:phenylacetate-CoA ligase
MNTGGKLELDALGDAARAEAVAARARANVRAYARHTGAAPTRWPEIPPTDKKSYLLAYPYAELLGDDFGESYTIFSSSGSSGRPFYWPQLKAAATGHVQRARELLEGAFRVHERRSLVIIGLALGSWIGGEQMSATLKALALSVPYPLAVFSPGNRHDEVLAMIGAAEAMVDQIIVCLCPSAIGHLRLRAEEQGRPLPLGKMRFLVLGEPFPEEARRELAAAAGTASDEAVMLSVFGSADTGVLGAESPASARVRGLCVQMPGLAAELGFGAVVPHLFHVFDSHAFLEISGGELLVTKWQGIPLVRYNLHDAARLLRWREIVERARRHLAKAGAEADSDTLGFLDHAAGLPDVLALTGRADRCLLLCGTNLTEGMLDRALRAQELASWLTGNYRADVVLEEGRQRLAFTLELRPDALPEGADAGARSRIADELYPRLVAAIGEAQPEFLDDWRSVYQRWDGDAARRIIRIELVRWPALAETTAIKQRGIGA